MRRLPIVILLGSVLAAAGAQATTYVRVEKDGSKTYSDRPLPGGHPVELQPAQTYSAPPTPSTYSARSSEQRDALEAANFHYVCALTPRADETFQNPTSVTLAVQASPGLRGDDRVKFLLDGTALPNEENSLTRTVEYPDRGSHTLNVQIQDPYGKILCNATSTFHVMRTGLNSPQNRPPPKPPKPPRPTPHPGPK